MCAEGWCGAEGAVAGSCTCVRVCVCVWVSVEFQRLGFWRQIRACVAVPASGQSSESWGYTVSHWQSCSQSYLVSRRLSLSVRSTQGGFVFFFFFSSYKTSVLCVPMFPYLIFFFHLLIGRLWNTGNTGREKEPHMELRSWVRSRPRMLLLHRWHPRLLAHQSHPHAAI